MKKLNKKVLNVMATAALLTSVAAPAMAATPSRVSEIPTYNDDKDGAVLASLTFQEDTDVLDELTDGTLTLTFPNGAKVKNISTDGSSDGLDIETSIVGDYTVNIKVTGTDAEGRDTLKITPTVDLDGFSGSAVEVEVQSFGAGVNAGKYKLANVASGDTISTVLNTKTVGEGGGPLGSIRIEETAVGNFEDEDVITLKLPKGVEWDKDITEESIKFLGGMDGFVTVDEVTLEGTRTLKIKLDVTDGAATRGYVQVTPEVTVDEDDAKIGDITLEVSGDNVSSQDLVVGTYSDYAVKVEADDDATEIIAGRGNFEDAEKNEDGETEYVAVTEYDKDEHKLAKILVKETVADSIAPNRKTKVEFPSFVKLVKVDVTGGKNIDEQDLEDAINEAISGDSDDANEVEFQVNAIDETEKVEFKLEFIVSVQADKTGDIEAVFSGRQGIEGKALVGKAVAPVTATAPSEKVIIGKKAQAIGEITLKESVKGAINSESDKNELRLELPESVEWNDEGKIEVVEGDLELDTKNIDTEDNVLIIPIKSESTKASTIKISGATIDVDRTVPEGAIKAKVKGSAVVQNNGRKDGVGEFDVTKVTEVEVANVATPAPGTVYANALFTIDSATYTVNGVEKTADVAPFIQDGRTFLPVRFIAEALGVTESNIIFNPASKTVTLIKGDRVAQIQIGSKNLVVNGVSVPMDVAAAVKDGRTVLPLRFAAQALGADVQWDEATRTVSVK